MASSSKKRAREEDISIRVAAGQPLAAESLMLRTLSSCARELPADAQEWDVSGLLLDGQPFSREAVACWLACAYGLVDGMAQLDAASISQLSTVTGLTQVLAFADAVGSSVGLVSAACSQLQQLRFVVQLPEQKTLELPVGDSSLYFLKNMHTGRKQLTQCSLKDFLPVGNPMSVEQQRNLQQQVAQQLAALLRLAHTLRVQPLLDVLHQFVLLNSLPGTGRLLTGVMGLVFSDAVLEAALGSSSRSREAYVSSVLSVPCSLTPDAAGHASLLKPVGPKTYEAATETLSFDAVLRRDFLGVRAGETVKVGLGLFGKPSGTQAVMRLAGSKSVDLPVQLLVGRSFPDAAALEAFLKVCDAQQ